MKNCFVFVCGPAVGKTYLAIHDDRFVDLDDEKAKYKYGLFDATRQELEEGKLNRGKTVNKDSSEYIIGRMKEELALGKRVLFAFSGSVVKYLQENNIPYCTVFASKDQQEEYRNRMIKRGNTSKFVDEMTNTDKWNRFYEENIKDPYPNKKIELKKGQYLSDIVDELI